MGLQFDPTKMLSEIQTITNALQLINDHIDHMSTPLKGSIRPVEKYQYDLASTEANMQKAMKTLPELCAAIDQFAKSTPLKTLVLEQKTQLDSRAEKLANRIDNLPCIFGNSQTIEGIRQKFSSLQPGPKEKTELLGLHTRIILTTQLPFLTDSQKKELIDLDIAVQIKSCGAIKAKDRHAKQAINATPNIIAHKEETPDYKWTDVQQILITLHNLKDDIDESTLKSRDGVIRTKLLELKELSPSLFESITFQIWDRSGRPDIVNFGLNHSGENLKLLQEIVEKLFRTTWSPYQEKLVKEVKIQIEIQTFADDLDLNDKQKLLCKILEKIPSIKLMEDADMRNEHARKLIQGIPDAAMRASISSMICLSEGKPEKLWYGVYHAGDHLDIFSIAISDALKTSISKSQMSKAKQVFAQKAGFSPLEKALYELSIQSIVLNAGLEEYRNSGITELLLKIKAESEDAFNSLTYHIWEKAGRPDEYEYALNKAGDHIDILTEYLETVAPKADFSLIEKNTTATYAMLLATVLE